MSDINKPGMGFDVNIRTANNNKSTKRDDGIPFNIAVLGDFSGRFSQIRQEDIPVSQRKLISIDRDNFDEVLGGFKLTFTISPNDQSESSIAVAISELDDFHPDTLYEKLEVFSKLRNIRQRLKNKSSFDTAAGEILGWLVADKELDQNTSTSQENHPVVSHQQNNLLNSILDSTPQTSSELEYVTRPGGIDQLIKEIIAPYVEPATNPRQQEMLYAVDEATSEYMRKILHHPHFQSIEAAWRSVYFLISRIETSSNLKIFLLDISKKELETDLMDGVNSSAIHKLFCDPSINDTPWSLLVGNYTFEDKIDDILLLAQIGSIAQSAHAPFLAAAKETLAACESFSQYPDSDDWQYIIKPGVENAWNMLRNDSVADYIGLALPRFLLRAPYGEKSKPIESFKFEEITSSKEQNHEQFLWGNAAFIKAEQLARAFTKSHWEMSLDSSNQTSNLPMYYYEENGVTQLMPCAETYLTEKGGRKLSEQGLIALWSMNNMDAIKSSDFIALSVDRKNLQGRWA